MSITVLDWRISPRLPRVPNERGELVFSTRGEPSRGWVLHHMGSGGTTFTVEQANAHHQAKTDWSSDGTARAPHVAYHAHAPRAYRSWAAARAIWLPDDCTGIVIVCNYAWERSWHATRANDAYWGLSLQIDGNADTPDDGQLAAIQYVLDGGLDVAAYGFTRPEHQQVWGHRQLGAAPPPWWNAAWGAWVDYGNATDCPGDRVQTLIDAYMVDGVPFWAPPVEDGEMGLAEARQIAEGSYTEAAGALWQARIDDARWAQLRSVLHTPGATVGDLCQAIAKEQWDAVAAEFGRLLGALRS